MYRFLFTPKWLAFHLLVVIAVVTMVNLGFWQLRRLDERKEFNATVESRYDEPPVALDELLTPSTETDTYDDLEWRPVTASGTYLPEETIVIVNRSQNGAAGRNVVVPLLLGDGDLVLINRGFVPLSIAELPPVPAVDVDIVGHLRESQERRTGQLSDPAEGDLAEAQRVDIERLAPQLPGDVLPMYLDLATSDPPEEPNYPQPVATPDLSERNHLSYAFQWFIFSIAVAIGWVLAVRKSISNHRRPPRTPGIPVEGTPEPADA